MKIKITHLGSIHPLYDIRTSLKERGLAVCSKYRIIEIEPEEIKNG